MNLVVGVILTLERESLAACLTLIHYLNVTVLVFCHSVRRAKQAWAIRAWCREMIVQIVLVVVTYCIQLCSTNTTLKFPTSA